MVLSISLITLFFFISLTTRLHKCMSIKMCISSMCMVPPYKVGAAMLLLSTAISVRFRCLRMFCNVATIVAMCMIEYHPLFTIQDRAPINHMHLPSACMQTVTCSLLDRSVISSTINEKYIFSFSDLV